MSLKRKASPFASPCALPKPVKGFRRSKSPTPRATSPRPRASRAKDDVKPEILLRREAPATPRRRLLGGWAKFLCAAVALGAARVATRWPWDGKHEMGLEVSRGVVEGFGLESERVDLGASAAFDFRLAAAAVDLAVLEPERYAGGSNQGNEKLVRSGLQKLGAAVEAVLGALAKAQLGEVAEVRRLGTAIGKLTALEVPTGTGHKRITYYRTVGPEKKRVLLSVNLAGADIKAEVEAALQAYRRVQQARDLSSTLRGTIFAPVVTPLVATFCNAQSRAVGQHLGAALAKLS